MTTRADVNRLVSAQREIVTLARTDLDRFWRSYVGMSPEEFRDELLEFVPRLVRQYGDMSATVAAEWYEEVRAAQLGGSYRALTGSAAAPNAVQETVRFAAGHLFDDTTDVGLSLLNGAVQRFVSYSGRDTVARNVRSDRARPRWGRVPVGKTCAFCELVASRGFVYWSAATAGEMGQYHDDCDCQQVPEFDAEASHIEGYDPDAMYDRYLTARDAAGSGDPNAILAKMRELFPEDYTDGHAAA